MLSDPTMLCDVLGLENEPQLRPATITGYECKLWGQYAALLHGPTGSVVHGAVYYVPTVEQGERLARYETNSYRVEPRCIRYTDGDRSMEELGYTFKFVGNGNDLTEGGV
ncbi:hypothetical protein BDW59DRAFT_150709 [Aspergillus cavernicola]|uniref:Gamma-glutamylcyclotransferase AIG2-like domain-containing protein n=1 Tax=Aspergillus cavernicola TaxID=176166 RepID=A0ABR4HZV1_9EURO